MLFHQDRTQVNTSQQQRMHPSILVQERQQTHTCFMVRQYAMLCASECVRKSE